MTRRLVEGNHHPGNPFTGDPKETDLPRYCPVCGRSDLKPWQWVTVDKEKIYPSLVCYGGTPSWLIPIRRLFGLIPTTPTGAHYQYDLPIRNVAKPETWFDRQTGRFLG